MGQEVRIGKDTLGSGNKMKTYMHGYERSSHDMSYLWRSTMGAGTLVPFMNEIGTSGTTHDLDLTCEILTMPTVGPLFGSYKVQLDVFAYPIRLYQGRLHNNELEIGLKMNDVKLPQMRLVGHIIDRAKGNIDNQQIHSSCLLKYLGIAGLGYQKNEIPLIKQVARQFNALGMIGYYDIYKNYYANKQEEIGMVINHSQIALTENITDFTLETDGGSVSIPSTGTTLQEEILGENSYITIDFDSLTQEFNPERIKIIGPDGWVAIDELYDDIIFDLANDRISARLIKQEWLNKVLKFYRYEFNKGASEGENTEPRLESFPLSNIDNMRKKLQSANTASAVVLNNTEEAPYGWLLDYTAASDGLVTWSAMANNQQGLAVKTYQSDLYNNWISTEWIDGDNGVNAITAIDTSDGSFTIDALNMAQKVYNLLNRITLSGGSYDDWLSAVYTHDRIKAPTTPMYMGGLSKELVFQEVISNAETTDQPLGTLAGRGRLNSKHKGGRIRVRVDEPSYMMGIVSITPRIDYSQGNKWDVNLKTMDDLHKPALDAMGYQDVITDHMAFWDTTLGDSTGGATPIPEYKSAGKQPAWINYMSNVNRVFGNFAIENEQMFMVLNRRYEMKEIGLDTGSIIKDLTTYIDPAKYNHIFADTRRDGQNFWVQIGVNLISRRKMSAKQIPNL